MKFIVRENKIRLDSFLASAIKGISRSRIQKDIEGSCVKVNGKKIQRSGEVIRDNDVVEYEISKDGHEILAEPWDIKVLYENADILIIDKPPGLVVHPASGYKGSTLVNQLLGHYKNIQEVGEEKSRPGIIHRLDKDTSGVMVVAKTMRMFEHLKDAFASRRIKKEYMALLCGRLPSKHGFINAMIGRHPKDFRKMAAVRSGNGKQAVRNPKEAFTEYWVLEYLPGTATGNVDGYTLVRVKLHTGRTHQIRVHFSSLGFPVAGDALYSRKCAAMFLSRQFLHAAKIEVQLLDGTWIEAESDLPADLKKVLENLRASRQDAGLN